MSTRRPNLQPKLGLASVRKEAQMQRALLFRPGLVPYTVALDWQRQLLARRVADRGLPDVLMLLEHPPVYTLGQGADLKYVLADPGEIELHRVERGGEVTYHGPGQIVGYPILDLHNHQRDLHWYLRTLEEVLSEVLVRFGIKAGRREGLTGVWVEERKLAAIGIKVSRWVTMHGFALNVNPDLSAFEAIVPCGLKAPVGSMAQFYPGVDLTTVESTVADCFARVFGLKFEQISALELRF